jgi:DNA-3-methyladenine glycosylase II
MKAVARPAPPRGVTGRRLKTALAHLAAVDPDMARAIALIGPPPPRWYGGGFPGLLHIILGQQVSIASAAAIWGRFSALADPLTPAAVLAADDAVLRGIGLSRQKMVYARALAQGIADGTIDLEALETMPDETAIAALMTLKGVGRWTAEVYLLFGLGRPDILPADDLGLLTAAQRLKGLAQRPSAAELRAMAEAWRPWRGVAARLLWHWYRYGPPGAGPKATARPAPPPPSTGSG